METYDANLIFLIGIVLHQTPLLGRRRLSTLFVLYLFVYMYISTLYEGDVSSEITIPPAPKQISTYRELVGKGFYVYMDMHFDSAVAATIAQKGINTSIHMDPRKCREGHAGKLSRCAEKSDMDSLRITLDHLRKKYNSSTCNSVRELLFEGLIIWPISGQRSDLVASFVSAISWNGLFQFYKSLHDFVQDKPSRWLLSKEKASSLGLGPNTLVSFQLYAICTAISILGFIGEIMVKYGCLRIERTETTPVYKFTP